MTRNEFFNQFGKEAQFGIIYNKKANKQIKFSETATLTINVELFHTFRLAGNCCYEDEDVWSYDITYELNINGKTDKTSDFYEEIKWSDDYKSKVNCPADAVGYLHFWKGSFGDVCLRQDKVNAIIQAVAELKEELATEESKVFFNEKDVAKEEKEIEEKIESTLSEIKRCEKIITEAENTLARGEKLLKNADEQREWLIAYNNVINEGGEGYMTEPPVTEGMYEMAKQKILELKKLNNDFEKIEKYINKKESIIEKQIAKKFTWLEDNEKIEKVTDYKKLLEFIYNKKIDITITFETMESNFLELKNLKNMLKNKKANV